MNLEGLLEEARTASPARRIEWRDQIAAFGPEAIAGVRPWLAEPALAGFAIRVIERAGIAGDRPLAARTLRAARNGASPAIIADITWALQRLRTEPQPGEASERPVAPVSPDKPPRRRTTGAAGSR